MCVRDFLVKVTADYGPQASLGVMERLQQEAKVDRSVNDHDMAHSVGRETAKDYGSNFKAFDLCPVTFNYGCSHGFFEYVLARTDTPKEAATTICESRSSKDTFLIAGFTCYHGVGHGIMMAEAYSVQNSLKACNTLPTHEAKDGCWQGVFMENVNAGMSGRALPGVFKRSDPLSPCDKVGDKYKHECYINHSGWLMTVARNDLRKGSRYCLKAKGRYKSSCFQSIGLMVTNPTWQAGLGPDLVQARKPEAVIAAQLCGRFPAAGRKDCVIAGVDNLANFDRLETKRAGAFCNAVPDVARGGVLPAGRRQPREPDERRAGDRQSCSGLGSEGPSLPRGRRSVVMRIPALLLLLAVLVLTGCGGDDDEDGGGGGGRRNVVTITDDGFEPSTLTVSSGTTVTFENESSDDSWPASDVHPTHQLYPGFDAKKPLLAGRIVLVHLHEDRQLGVPQSPRAGRDGHDRRRVGAPSPWLFMSTRSVPLVTGVVLGGLSLAVYQLAGYSGWMLLLWLAGLFALGLHSGGRAHPYHGSRAATSWPA